MTDYSDNSAKQISREFTTKEKSDIRTLMRFVEIYCREKHTNEKSPFTFTRIDVKSIRKKDLMLCPECTKLLRYGLTMRLKCPHDPKPMCKKCTTQCYKGDYRSKIREIMKFSGIYLVKHGRLDMLYHYLR
ncbi:MAG: nitrous oxide-stimulated promoter family protein [Syntrophorhabdus sp.]